MQEKEGAHLDVRELRIASKQATVMVVIYIASTYIAPLMPAVWACHVVASLIFNQAVLASRALVHFLTKLFLKMLYFDHTRVPRFVFPQANGMKSKFTHVACYNVLSMSGDDISAIDPWAEYEVWVISY